MRKLRGLEQLLFLGLVALCIWITIQLLKGVSGRLLEGFQYTYTKARAPPPWKPMILAAIDRGNKILLADGNSSFTDPTWLKDSIGNARGIAGAQARLFIVGTDGILYATQQGKNFRDSNSWESLNRGVTQVSRGDTDVAIINSATGTTNYSSSNIEFNPTWRDYGGVAHHVSLSRGRVALVDSNRKLQYISNAAEPSTLVTLMSAAIEDRVFKMVCLDSIDATTQFAAALTTDGQIFVTDMFEGAATVQTPPRWFQPNTTVRTSYIAMKNGRMLMLDRSGRPFYCDDYRSGTWSPVALPVDLMSASVGTSTTSQAVRYIKILEAAPPVSDTLHFHQISVFTSANPNTNIALGKTVSASQALGPETTAATVIDGQPKVPGSPALVSVGEIPNKFFQLDLGQQHTLSKIEIINYPDQFSNGDMSKYKLQCLDANFNIKMEFPLNAMQKQTFMVGTVTGPKATSTTESILYAADAFVQLSAIEFVSYSSTPDWCGTGGRIGKLNGASSPRHRFYTYEECVNAVNTYPGTNIQSMHLAHTLGCQITDKSGNPLETLHTTCAAGQDRKAFADEAYLRPKYDDGSSTNLCKFNPFTYTDLYGKTGVTPVHENIGKVITDFIGENTNGVFGEGKIDRGYSPCGTTNTRCRFSQDAYVRMNPGVLKEMRENNISALTHYKTIGIGRGLAFCNTPDFIPLLPELSANQDSDIIKVPLPTNLSNKCTTFPVGEGNQVVCGTKEDAELVLAGKGGNEVYVTSKDSVCYNYDTKGQSKVFYCKSVIEDRNGYDYVPTLMDNYSVTCDFLKKYYMDLSNKLDTFDTITTDIQQNKGKLETAKQSLVARQTALGCGASAITAANSAMCSAIGNGIVSINENLQRLTSLETTLTGTVVTGASGSRAGIEEAIINSFNCMDEDEVEKQAIEVSTSPPRV